MTALAVRSGRALRTRKRQRILVILGVAVVALFAVSLMAGQTFYSPSEVWRVVAGEQVPGASFTVGVLRLPRAVLGLLTGLCFGIAGVTFQTLLRNPLASPDIIGISSGASAAAVTAIVFFGAGASAVSWAALGGALLAASLIYLLAIRGTFAGARLILIGIGLAAMLNSVVTYVLSRAAQWDLQTAMRWLTGSLNGATWEAILPLAVVAAIGIPVLLTSGRHLSVLRLGDDSAAALGVSVWVTRVALIVTAAGLLAFATAAAGPVAFVAFMSGPIAARIVGPGESLLIPAALIGALLVGVGDLAGQFAFDSRYPVGVITGAVGAPFLIYLLIRTNRSGASL